MPSPGYQSFAVTAPGLAELAASELTALGIQHDEPEAGGVTFTTDAAGLYAANLHLRTASRVLVRIDEFRAATFHELEKRAARIEWSEWIAPGRAVGLRVTCRKSRLYHSDAVAERVAGAMNQAGAEVTAAKGPESDEPNDEADSQLVVVRLLQDRCTISIDASGALLHQRGYRQALAKAPLRETLAAAMLIAAGHDPATPLLDPFCGSGTIPIEGAMIARRMAPGRNRGFAFQRWPSFEKQTWARVVDRSRSNELPAVSAAIVGSDRDDGAIEASRANAVRAEVAADIEFIKRAASAVEPPLLRGAGAIITNPPYGVRVGSATGDLRDLYARFGTVLRRHFAGWKVALLSADRRLLAQLQLPLEERLNTSNGGIPVRLMVGTAEEGRGQRS